MLHKNPCLLGSHHIERWMHFLEKGTIDGYVPKNINPTFFSIYGNLTFFVLCMLTLFLGRLFRN